MAVIMVMFNACDSARIVQNWLYVWNKMVSARIPVFGIELLYPWQQPALADAFKTLTVHSDSVMFHKEKLIERLLRDIPSSFTKVCYIDCDIIFHRADWYDAVSAELDRAQIVQPFSQCWWLGPDLHKQIRVKTSSAFEMDNIRRMISSGKNPLLLGHSGFAMAVHRSVPLFPWAIVGGGDDYFFRGVAGLTNNFAIPRIVELMNGVWKSWTSSIGTVQIGCVEGLIMHMWHGPLSSRQYSTRHRQFINAVPAAVTDIRDLIEENADGVWAWKSEYKTDMNKMMMQYFTDRNDDSVALS